MIEILYLQDPPEPLEQMACRDQLERLAPLVLMVRRGLMAGPERPEQPDQQAPQATPAQQDPRASQGPTGRRV